MPHRRMSKLCASLAAIATVSLAACDIASINDQMMGEKPSSAMAANGGWTGSDFAMLEARAKDLSGFSTNMYDANAYYRIIESGLVYAAGRAIAAGRSGTPLKPFDPLTVEAVIPSARGYSSEERRKFDALLEKAKRGVRIVGGVRVEKGQFTETVAIVDEGGAYNRVCTGTIVGAGKVLTAAHCVCAMKLLPGQSGKAKVYFGNPDAVASLGAAPSAMLFGHLTKLMDETFCGRFEEGHICGGDLAMVFYNPNETPGYARAARLMSQTEGESFLNSEDLATIVGYGETRDSRWDRPRVGRLVRGATKPKMVAVMPAPSRCGDYVTHCAPERSWRGCLPDVEVRLMDSALTRDTCNGDSGGPLFLDNNEWDSAQTLAAVTSRGMWPRRRCGTGGIYTSVFSDEAISWLDQVMDTEQ